MDPPPIKRGRSANKVAPEASGNQRVKSQPARTRKLPARLRSETRLISNTDNQDNLYGSQPEQLTSPHGSPQIAISTDNFVDRNTVLETSVRDLQTTVENLARVVMGLVQSTPTAAAQGVSTRCPPSAALGTANDPAVGLSLPSAQQGVSTSCPQVAEHTAKEPTSYAQSFASASAPSNYYGESTPMMTMLAPPQHRPVMLASGLQAGDNIPDRLKQRIWTHKYVDFSELINPHNSATYAMSLGGNTNTPVLNFTPKRKQFLTEFEWMDAWSDFRSVYAIKFPHEQQSLNTYEKMIRGLMRLGHDWRLYDYKFRVDREYNTCDWLAIRVDLQIEVREGKRSTSLPRGNFNNNQNQSSQGSQLFRGQSQGNQVEPGYCYKYHSPTERCNAPQCKYLHTCPRCSRRHPAFLPCNANPRQNQAGKQANFTTSDKPQPNANASQNKYPK